MMCRTERCVVAIVYTAILHNNYMYRMETACTNSTMRPSTMPMTRGGEGDDLNVMHLSDYLAENRLLYEFQSGLWSSHSTHTPLFTTI